MNEDTISITCISDTHTKHLQLNLTGGNLLICAGDITNMGSYSDLISFLNWFDKQNYTYKIFIAGNHDFYLEDHSTKNIQDTIYKLYGDNCNIIYLNDNGINLFGLNIWGSPVQPRFFDWAFNRDRGEDIKKHWNLIPDNTDILITHGPPSGILDKNESGQNTGCKDLLYKIIEINPIINIFGHIHEGYGYHDNGNTLFLNASVLDSRYNYKNKPIDLQLNIRTKEYKFI